MSWLTTAWQWLTSVREAVIETPQAAYSKRSLVMQLPYQEPANCQVDDLRERYSAAKYVAKLKEAMEGNHEGRGEWSRYITALSPDDYRVFFLDVDAIIEAGGLVHVLTAEEQAACKQRILDNIDHWRDESSKLEKDFGIDPALMNLAMSATRWSGDANGEVLRPVPFSREVDAKLMAMDDADASAWAEDIEDADIGEGDDDDENER